MMRKFIGAAFVALMATGSAWAADVKPAIVYGTGGKFDKSFNEAGYNGSEKFKAETGIDYKDFEPQNDTQGEQAIRNFAKRGYNPVVALSFAWTDAIAKVSKEFPDTQFVLVDSVVDAPNVRSVTFKEQEGGYLVGLLAAEKSASKKVGFVGGMDIPLIRNFACGYAIGAKAGGASFMQNYIGTTGAAWNDPVRGGELAKAQMEQGADVIYAAAGASGLGVLQTVADAGKLGIGVDSNQNHLHPGKILTSMVKRVDVAVFNAFADVKDGKFTPGLNALGLKENGVDWALDDNNRSLVTPEMEASVNKAREDIVAGKIDVHNYNTDEKCPVN